VQDLVQETFREFLKVPNVEVIREPLAYLYQVAGHLFLEFVQRMRRARVLYDSETVTLTAEQLRPGMITDEPGERVHYEQQLEHFARAFAELPPVYQAVLLLRLRDGLSRHDIARRLGLAEHTVKKYLYRAVSRCRMAGWNE
jgi:RNA polymerase sigma-19 factor, ECF subfamily